jgi:hypothetical protein
MSIHGFTLTYPGAMAGANTLTKYGSGTFFLPGSEIGNFLCCNLSRYIYCSETMLPVLTNQTFTGAGDLVIQPASAEFHVQHLIHQLLLLLERFHQVLLFLRMAVITLVFCRNINMLVNQEIQELLILVEILQLLETKLSYGPATLSADITSTITSGTVYVPGTVNGGEVTARSLTVSGGTLQFGGVVGGTNPLNNITAPNLVTTAVIQKTAGSCCWRCNVNCVQDFLVLGLDINTSGAQNYSGAVTLTTGAYYINSNWLYNPSWIYCFMARRLSLLQQVLLQGYVSSGVGVTAW